MITKRIKQYLEDRKKQKIKDIIKEENYKANTSYINTKQKINFNDLSEKEAKFLLVTKYSDFLYTDSKLLEDVICYEYTDVDKEYVRNLAKQLLN